MCVFSNNPTIHSLQLCNSTLKQTSFISWWATYSLFAQLAYSIFNLSRKKMLPSALYYIGATIYSFVSLPFIRNIKVTCIGDSITQGGACGSSESYVSILPSLLGENYQVMNAGVSSMTMLKQGFCNGLYSCSYWDTDAWQTALTSDPDIVTIMLGTNDAKSFNWEGIQQNKGDYFALDYVDMINQLKRLRTKPKIYLVIPSPLREPYPFEMNRTIINEVFPKLIRDIAKVVDVEVIDVFSALSPADFSCDG